MSLAPFPLATVKGFAWLAAGGSLGTLGLFFAKASALTFGSGLAVVPFLHQGLVTEHHWLTERQLTDAVAMGLISPGPVVIMGTFAGYLVAGAAIVIGRQTIHGWLSAAIGVVALALLLQKRIKVPEPALVAAAAIAGLAVH